MAATAHARGGAAQAPAQAPQAAPAAHAAYGDLPVAFEANQGQTDPQVSFTARADGYRLFVTPTEAVLRGRDSAVRLTAVGANPDARVTGGNKLAGTTSYFKGDLRLTGIPTYGTATVHSLYPGIDLAYHGAANRQVEYDYILSPGADPGAIRLAVTHSGSAIGSPTLDAQGNLVVGSFVQKRPVAFQEVAGRRQPVDAAYALEGDGTVTISLGAYDRTLPLVIDPVLSYSTYLGGSAGGLGDDEGDAITVDLSGNAYITGRTSTVDFPAAAPDNSLGGADDAFVTKLSPAGQILWSTYFGGDGFDQGLGIAYTQVGGAVWLTGLTTSSFPTFPIVNGFDATLGGTQDAFVARLDAASGFFQYSTFFGGDGDEAGYAVAADSNGAAVVTGLTTSTSASFPLLAPADPTLGGVQDAFLAKFSLAGAPLFSTYLGGSADETGYGVAVDGTDRIYVTGSTSSVDFPVLLPVLPPGGGQDAFVAAYASSGAPLYATYFGGNGDDIGYGIAADSAGTAYVTGSTTSTNLVVPVGFDTTLDGTQDAFVARLGPPAPGPALLAATYLGGTGDEAGYGIALDGSGDPVVTGFTSSAPGTGFPIFAPADQAFTGPEEAFVTRFTTNLSPVWSTYLGGSGTDEGFGIAALGTATYVTGFTTSADFPLANPFDATLGGTSDGFVAKLVPASLPATVRSSTQWRFRDTLTTGAETLGPITYGTTPLVPVAGDWNGDGIRTLGTYQGGTFYLRNSNSAGPADLTISFGSDPRGFPVIGDFDGDGRDDLAVFRNGLWQVHFMAGTDYTFSFGTGTWPTVVPVAGDWNGDGKDDVGVVTRSTGVWVLRDSGLAAGSQLSTFTFGAGAYPVVGDWNGDGYDTPGYRSGTTWSLSNTRVNVANPTPTVDITFDFGLANDFPIVWGM